MFFAQRTPWSTPTSSNRRLLSPQRRSGRGKGIAEALQASALVPAFGVSLRALLLHGVGVHHAVCSLLSSVGGASRAGGAAGRNLRHRHAGVGITVPIHTVVLSGLGEWMGTASALVKVREFQQIAGRPGEPASTRRGW